MGYILAAKWFLSFWCNYSQQPLSSSFLSESVWWDLQAGLLLCVWEALICMRMPSTFCVCVCVKKVYHTPWFQHIKNTQTHYTHVHHAWLYRLPWLQVMLKFSNSTNKQQSQINSQTSLKQHLPLTTSAHQLKGSHRRSIKIDSLFGRWVPKYAAFSFTTSGTDTDKMETVQRCWDASASTELLWC